MTDARKLYANVSFELDPEETELIYLERQELAFKYFYHLNKSSKILNDAKALNALQYTHSNLSKRFKLVNQQIELSLKYDFTKIILNIIENCYQRIIECIHFIKQVNEVNDKNRIGSMAICLLAMEILDIFTYHSKKFSIKFHLDNHPVSFKIIFNVINNRKIQENCSMLKKNQSDSQEFVLMRGIFKSLFSSMVNLTRHANFKCKKIWHELNSIETLEDYLDRMNGILFNLTYVHLIKAYLMDENLSDGVIKYLIGLFRLIVYQNTRIEVKIEPTQKRKHKIAYTNISGHIFNLIDLIRVLYKIALNDKFKMAIYFKFKLKKYLIKAIYNSTEFELGYSLRLLWNFCYDDQIAKDIKENELLMKFLMKLTQSNDKHFIQNISAGILCLLNSKFTNFIQINSSNTYSNIMIIDQSENLDLCLTIKNELEKNEYTIYLDYDRDSDFTSKLMQIEKSFCILICLNENFEISNESNNTGFRALCDHAIKMNKKLIPIIMHKNNIIEQLNSHSWLDEILRRNIIFYVYKSSFHLCFNGLSEHILSIKERQINKNRYIFDWNEKTVEEWLKSKSLNQKLIDHLVPCNGSILHEFYLISLSAPNYFYQQLSNIQNENDHVQIEYDSDTNLQPITVNEFTLFKKYLKELFE